MDAKNRYFSEIGTFRRYCAWGDAGCQNHKSNWYEYRYVPDGHGGWHPSSDFFTPDTENLDEELADGSKSIVDSATSPIPELSELCKEAEEGFWREIWEEGKANLER